MKYADYQPILFATVQHGTNMTDATLLTILGSFISLLLIVNAYFTRETLARVVRIEVRLENNATRQEFVEKQTDDNTKEIRKIRDRLHTLEGSQAQLLAYLEDNKSR